jgi:hypothetical protein
LLGFHHQEVTIQDVPGEKVNVCIYMGFLQFSFPMRRSWPAASTPNLEGQVIFDQGFLPLALDKPISICKAAVLVLIRPGYFIYPVLAISGEHFPHPPPGKAPDGRLAAPH